MKFACKIIFLLFCLVSLKASAQNEFITEWQTGTTLQFPGIGNNYTLVWQNVNNPASTGTITNAVSGQNITLPASGTYLVKASNGNGVFIGFNANTYATNSSSLRFVRQWGNIQWSSLKYAFYNCYNMDVTASDVPDLSNVKDLSFMFCLAQSLKGNSSFNNWNTANVTNMGSMFSRASAFNQPIGSWKTENVTDMSIMFSYASAFNQPIGNWITAKVTSMSYMFKDASAFNQPLNNWNTAKVSDMYNMFRNASAFNQSLSNWNLSSVSSLSNMLIGSGIDCTNYSATLNGWANASTTPNGVTLDADGLFYNASALAAHDKLTGTKRWTINGDYYYATCGASTLPVSFGNLNAVIKNNVLNINWSTQTETNNGHFEIEVSKDGKNFKPLATVKSQAVNGNSAATINYNWSGGANTIAAVFALSLLALMPSARSKKYRFYALLFFSLINVIFYSCSKNDAIVKNDITQNYIRIKQVDKDGGFEYSQTVKVISE